MIDATAHQVVAMQWKLRPLEISRHLNVCCHVEGQSCCMQSKVSEGSRLTVELDPEGRV